MARATTWTNSDGLDVGFGKRDSYNAESATIRTMGNEEILQVALKWDALPSAATNAASEKNVPIPAGSVITNADLYILDAFESGGATTLSIGLKRLDGTDIDADGIDATIAKTAMDADRDVVQCDGALVNGVVDIGAYDGYISTVVATGPYTAGEGVLTIRYTRPAPDPMPLDPITTVVGSL